MKELALAFGGDRGAPAGDAAGLGAAFDHLYQKARAAWPSVELSPGAFARHLGERAADLSQLETLRIADLYLACACLHGDAGAQKIVDESLLSQVPRFVARVDPDAADEVVQNLREKLFWPRGGPSILLRYSGRGDLLSWIRVLAIRAALRKRRGAPRPPPAPELLAAIDPELEYLKERYRAEVQAALKTALAGLGDHERVLLFLRYADRVNIDRIGAMYGVHRATIARRIASARRTVLEETRRALSLRLKLDESELDSLIAFVRSRLGISLRPAAPEVP